MLKVSSYSGIPVLTPAVPLASALLYSLEPGPRGSVPSATTAECPGSSTMVRPFVRGSVSVLSGDFGVGDAGGSVPLFSSCPAEASDSDSSCVFWTASGREVEHPAVSRAAHNNMTSNFFICPFLSCF